MKKWTNVRDAFLRSLKCESGQSSKKKYIYGEHLQFLLKTGQKCQTVNNYHDEDEDMLVNDGSSTTDVFQQDEFEDQINPTQSEIPVPMQTVAKSRQTKKKVLDPIEREILKEIKRPKLHAERSDHEMILSSFIPHIRDMTDSELLEFQMRTLETIKHIKQSRATRLFNPIVVEIQNSSAGSKSVPSERSSMPPTELHLKQTVKSPVTSDMGSNVYQHLFDNCELECE